MQKILIVKKEKNLVEEESITYIKEIKKEGAEKTSIKEYEEKEKKERQHHVQQM